MVDLLKKVMFLFLLIIEFLIMEMVFFESIKIINSKPFNLSCHIDRINLSCNILKLRGNYTQAFLQKDILFNRD